MDSIKNSLFDTQNKKKTIASMLLALALLIVAVFELNNPTDAWADCIAEENDWAVVIPKKLQPTLKSITATYGDQTVTFVPAFANDTGSTYLANVKFYNTCGNEITSITSTINNNSLIMCSLYTNYFNSGDNNLIPTYVSNSGCTVTFYGMLDGRID